MQKEEVVTSFEFSSRNLHKISGKTTQHLSQKRIPAQNRTGCFLYTRKKRCCLYHSVGFVSEQAEVKLYVLYQRNVDTPSRSKQRVILCFVLYFFLPMFRVVRKQGNIHSRINYCRKSNMEFPRHHKVQRNLGEDQRPDY